MLRRAVQAEPGWVQSWQVSTGAGSVLILTLFGTYLLFVYAAATGPRCPPAVPARPARRGNLEASRWRLPAAA